MASETRTIEKYGILKLSPADRGSCNLLVTSEVIQLPFSEYINTKSNPFKGHYGYACLMYGEFVVQLIDLQFRQQIILDKNQYVVQLAHQEFHNSKLIAGLLAEVTFPDTVEYPIWNFDELRFKLEPGVIIKVFKSSIPMVDVEPDGVSQPNLTPPAPNPNGPTPPPPESTPKDEKIPLSAPYDGPDDGGNTYVRPDPPPPPDPEEGKVNTWKVHFDGPGFSGDAFYEFRGTPSVSRGSDGRVVDVTGGDPAAPYPPLVLVTRRAFSGVDASGTVTVTKV